jgi:putative SOS response-associated peptidase YedK
VWHDRHVVAIPPFTTVTTEPNGLAATIHNRMPVIVVVTAEQQISYLGHGVRASVKLMTTN